MSVPETLRRLYSGLVIVMIIAASLPAWAEGEAEQIASANQLIAEKKYDDAITILTPLISSPEPTALDAKRALQECYCNTGQYAKAIPILESINRDYLWQNITYWQSTLGTAYRTTGDFQKAMAALKDGVDSGPLPLAQTRKLCELLWCCFVARDEWGEAVEFYKPLLAKWPQREAEWRYWMALPYRRMGMRAEAIEYLEKALELCKGDLDAIKRIQPELTGAYNDSQQPEKAEALLAKLEKDYPGYGEYCRRQQALPRIASKYSAARALAEQGYMLQRGGVYDRAITTFQEVIERYPNAKRLVESAHVCIAECLQQMGKPDEGMAYAKKMYDEQPDMRGGALFAQGIVSFWSKDFDASVAAFRRVISEYPNDQHAGYVRPLLVEALAKAGRTDEAVTMLREMSAGASDPRVKTANLLQIGVIYQDAKKHRDATAAFREVRDLKDAPAETKAEATYRSGVCYQALKYYSSARKCMDQVIRLCPDSQWATKARGALYAWASFGEQAKVK